MRDLIEMTYKCTSTPIIECHKCKYYNECILCEILRNDKMDKLKLAMLAGAYAIRNNKKLECGEYVYNVFENPESISWKDAEKYLVCAVNGLNPEECEIKQYYRSENNEK